MHRRKINYTTTTTINGSIFLKIPQLRDASQLKLNYIQAFFHKTASDQ